MKIAVGCDHIVTEIKNEIEILNIEISKKNGK